MSLLPTLPATCHYIPNFLTPTEEASILCQIHATPAKRWTHLSHRRLLALPSALTRDTLIAKPLPAYLANLLPRFADFFAASPHGVPNHVLVNEYRPGQGIMPHQDGPAYYPCTATVSLGAAVVLDVYGKNGERWRILQEPRSLLVTSGDMYTDTLHGIDAVMVDEVGEGIANWALLGERYAPRLERELRVSLTYRDVVKVAKLGGAMTFLGKR